MASSVSDDDAMSVENEAKTAPLALDSLPAEIIIKILRLLPIDDILSLAEMGHGCRLGRIANDPSNFRTFTFSKYYQLTRETLRVLLSTKRDHIHYLDISNCYWLTPDDFTSLDFRLPNLKHLDVRHTNIPFKTLHSLLSHTNSLRSLSYDQNCGVKLYDISRAAMRTLRRVKELNAVCVPGKCVGMNGERSLLEYGRGYRQLKAFSVDARYTEQVDMRCSCGRSLTDIIPFGNLRHFMIGRRARDAHHRSLHFDTVQYSACLCSVLFTDGCFSQTDTHISDGGDNPRPIADTFPSEILSLQMIRVPDLKLPPYRSLRYLNIVGSVDFTGLRAVATNCRHLESLNISYCRDALKKIHKCEEWTDLSAFRIFVEAKTPLKHLNISGLHPHLPDNELCEVLAQIPGLVSLSLPVCSLPEWIMSVDGLTFGQIKSRTRSFGSGELKCAQCSRNGSGGGARSSITKYNESTKEDGCVYCTSDLSKLVTGCSAMRSFELIKTGFVSFLSPGAASKDEDTIRCGDIMDSESMVLCLSRWKHLTSLVLAGLPSIIHGWSLVAVAQGCPLLHSLSLAHLGPHPYDLQCLFMDGLCEALKYTQMLQDFRFEQPKVVGMQSLLQSLQRCPRLHRVCLITQSGRIKALDELYHVMDRCVDLTVLQVICNAYFETCAKWQQALIDKYKHSRPAVHVTIVSYKKCEATRWRDVCDKIPFIHLDELTLFQTKVATKAPSWKEIQKIRRWEHVKNKNL